MCMTRMYAYMLNENIQIFLQPKIFSPPFMDGIYLRKVVELIEREGVFSCRGNDNVNFRWDFPLSFIFLGVENDKKVLAIKIKLLSESS